MHPLKRIMKEYGTPQSFFRIYPLIDRNNLPIKSKDTHIILNLERIHKEDHDPHCFIWIAPLHLVSRNFFAINRQLTHSFLIRKVKDWPQWTLIIHNTLVHYFRTNYWKIRTSSSQLLRNARDTL